MKYSLKRWEMFMKKSSITGWKDIYSFTLIQTLKSKAYIISYIIFLVMALASMPLISLLTSSGDKEEVTKSPVTMVYVYNNTTLPEVDFSPVHEDENLSHITFIAATEDYETVSERIESNENTSVILNITDDTNAYLLSFVKASEGPVSDSSIQLLATAVQKCYENYKVNVLGITEEQLAMIHSKVETKVTMTDTLGSEIIEEDTSISHNEYLFIYVILFVVMMVNVMASSQIATSIVSDKSSRVIEYLLTSVKPLAIMVGKILAMLTAVLFQVMSLFIVALISNKITAILLTDGENILDQYISKDILSNINIFNLLLCLILIALGMIFYATLAGLAGATVSRIEEASESLTLFTLANLVGVYIGMGAVSVLLGSGENAFVYFAFLFPLSSTFILPGAILAGKVSLLLVAGALVLQIIFVILLFRFVAKVYETLILHNGNKIGLKELIRMSKTV